MYKQVQLSCSLFGISPPPSPAHLLPHWKTQQGPCPPAGVSGAGSAILGKAGGKMQLAVWGGGLAAGVRSAGGARPLRLAAGYAHAVAVAVSPHSAQSHPLGSSLLGLIHVFFSRRSPDLDCLDLSLNDLA